MLLIDNICANESGRISKILLGFLKKYISANRRVVGCKAMNCARYLNKYKTET